MTSRIVLAGFVALAGSFMVGQEADAASYRHIDTLALRLQSHSAKLSHEFRLHYSHTPEYLYLMSDARSLFNRSKHIHALAHHHGSLHCLASNLRALDHSFHHLERLIHHIGFDADHGHIGHIHGRTSYVHRLMKQMGCDIHHLRADIKELTRCHHGGHVIIPVTRSRNYGEVRSNWKFGLNDLHRGRSRIKRSIR